MYKKIDLYFDGDYLCSTNQSKTCKDAKANLLLTYELYLSNPERYGFTRVQIAMFKHVVFSPKLLKANFSKQ